MILTSIKYFCVVVKLGSISKAAIALHMSQPALSLQIKELENQLNNILLVRSNKGVTPTEVGKKVYDYGTKMLALYDNMIGEINKTSFLQTDIKIAAASTVGQYALPCTIYIFQENHPEINVNAIITNTENVIERLLNNSINIGLLEGPISEATRKHFAKENIILKKLGRDELIIIAPYNNHWKDIDSISLNEFKKLPWILREKGSGIYSTIEEKLLKENIKMSQLNNILTFDQTNAIISAVASGKGYSLVPRLAIRKDLFYKTLKGIRLKEFLFYHTISLAYKPEKIVSPLDQSFLHLLFSKERGFC
ncbi:MAG: LysR family transcriptional regulator [Bacillota bacterium]|nr:LysR family transcriptional regulator [Bacillota bacterium]